MGDVQVCLYAFYLEAAGSSVGIYMYIFRWLLRVFVAVVAAAVVVVVAVAVGREEEEEEEGG